VVYVCIYLRKIVSVHLTIFLISPSSEFGGYCESFLFAGEHSMNFREMCPILGPLDRVFSATILKLRVWAHSFLSVSVRSAEIRSGNTRIFA